MLGDLGEALDLADTLGGEAEEFGVSINAAFSLCDGRGDVVGVDISHSLDADGVGAADGDGASGYGAGGAFLVVVMVHSFCFGTAFQANRIRYYWLENLDRLEVLDILD